MTHAGQHRSQVKKFVLNSLCGNSDSLEFLGVFQEILVNIGDFLRQKDPDLFEEMMRYFADTAIISSIKRKTNLRRMTNG